MANTARVTQSFAEAATTAVGTARVTQSFVEFATGLGISCGSPPSGIAGIFYSTTFPSGGNIGTVTYSIISGSLPPGLLLNGSTGTASGIPTSAGTFTFTVQASDTSLMVAQVTCSITITGATAGGSFNLGGSAHRKCFPYETKPVNKVDWSQMQRTIDAVRPAVLDECVPPDGLRWRN